MSSPSDYRSINKMVKSIIARWKAGEEDADAMTFLREHPEICQHHGLMVDLAYEEYCQRTERGETLDINRFARRFPVVEVSLKRCVTLHHVFPSYGATSFEEINWPAIGEVIEQYRFVELLGTGAFSRVYLAHDGKLGDREVVIKVCSKETHEAGTLGKLDHSFVVPIHTQIEFDEYTMILMPFLGRATLADVLEGLRDGWESAKPSVRDLWQKLHGARASSTFYRGSAAHRETMLLWSAEIAEGLAHCHEQGIYHLDLKPSNILITNDGKPRLFDFNLSRDDSGKGSIGGGTIPYMAPEQLEFVRNLGSMHRLNSQTDLFSMGIILYEMYTLELPFKTDLGSARSVEELANQIEAAHQNGRSPWPTPELAPHRLMGIADRCMSPDPDERPASIHELVEPLRSEHSWGKRQLRWWSQRWYFSLAILLLAAAGIFVLTNALMNRGDVVETNYRYAINAYNDDEYQDALRFLNRALEHDPDHLDSLVARGRLLAQMGDYPSAMRDGRRVLELEESSKTRAALGYCYHKMRLYPYSIQWYRSALRRAESPLVTENLASAYVANRQFRDALDLANQVLQINPKSTFGLRLKAYLIKHRLSDGYPQHFEAFDLANKGLELSPNDVRFHMLRTAAFVRTLKANPDRIERARSMAREAARAGAPYNWFVENPQAIALVEDEIDVESLGIKDIEMFPINDFFLGD